jgi:hypothetical protein
LFLFSNILFFLFTPFLFLLARAFFFFFFFPFSPHPTLFLPLLKPLSYTSDESYALHTNNIHQLIFASIDVMTLKKIPAQFSSCSSVFSINSITFSFSPLRSDRLDVNELVAYRLVQQMRSDRITLGVEDIVSAAAHEHFSARIRDLTSLRDVGEMD